MKYSLLIFAAVLFLAPSQMEATAASAQWYVRRPTPAGSDAAGVNACGGYDGVTYPGGTNYADQDAPQVTFSAGNANELSAAQNSTTLTSAGAPFTSAMVGNCILITTTGTGGFMTKGYYFIQSVTDASNVVLDRPPATTGAGAAADGYLGGAPNTILPYCSTAALGTCGSNGVGSPLVGGNTVNIQGAGSTDPTCTAVTFNYDWSGGWVAMTVGSGTTGAIVVQGYNGRPCIKQSGLMFHDTADAFRRYDNLKFFATAGNSSGVWDGGQLTIQNIILDCNGVATCIFYVGGANPVVIRSNEIRNSSGTTGQTWAAIDLSNAKASVVVNNYIHGVRGYGIKLPASNLLYLNDISGNIIASTGNHALVGSGSSSSPQLNRVVGNTLYQPNGDCLNLGAAAQLTDLQFYNNICYQPTGYGINANFGSAAANEFLKFRMIDYNDIFGAGTAAYNNLNAGSHDLALDPKFVNAASANFAIGANLRGKGYPGLFLNTNSTSSVSMGAIQPSSLGTVVLPFVQ